MATPSFFLRFVLSGSLLLFWLLCTLNNSHALVRRETTESRHHSVQVSSLLPPSVCNPSNKGANRSGASLKVVHGLGPCSPHSRGDVNALTLAQILAHDQSRVNSIRSQLASSLGKNRSSRHSQATLPAKFAEPTTPGIYIVTIGLGTPKKDLSLIFDTGSHLLWTQCKPCTKCFNQKQPKFDPSKSSSYSYVPCNSPACSQLPSATGGLPGCSTNKCIYKTAYLDQSSSSGYLAKEKLTLTSTDVFDGFLFGCGRNNSGDTYLGSAGVLGLGRDKLSIVSQTANKHGKYFSYCIPTASSSSGHLTFGKNGIPSNVKFTPILNLKTEPTLYPIGITAINVGGRRLPISPTVFKTAGAIIDSGSAVTRLPPAAYKALETAFRRLMTKYPLTKGDFDTCYDLSNYTTVSVPKIEFYFSGNVKVDITVTGILYGETRSQVCFLFIGNSYASDGAIFGILQQQTLEVVYDIPGGKIGFGPGGC